VEDDIRRMEELRDQVTMLMKSSEELIYSWDREAGKARAEAREQRTRSLNHRTGWE